MSPTHTASLYLSHIQVYLLASTMHTLNVALRLLLLTIAVSRGSRHRVQAQGLDVDLKDFQGASNRLQPQGNRWTQSIHASTGLLESWARQRRRAPCIGDRATANLCGASLLSTVDAATLLIATSPAYYDTRNKSHTGGLYLAPEPRDQGICNACVAYAVAAAAQSAAATTLAVNSSAVPFVSARQLMFCGPQKADCGTGWKLQQALPVLDESSKWAKEGLFAYDCMPMDDVTNEMPSEDYCKPTCNNKAPAGSFTYTKAKPLVEIWQIQEHVRTYGASVVTRMTLVPEFKTFFSNVSNRRAIYDNITEAKDATWPDSAENHAVVIAGYNNIESYWLIWSSWGEEWADAGFAKVRYGQLGIGDPMFTFGVIFRPEKPPQPNYHLTKSAGSQTGCYSYQVQPGDYLSRVSRKLKAPVKKLISANIGHIDSPDEWLSAGQTLLVCGIQPDCAPIDNCYSCQLVPGCVWCYEPPAPGIKTHCVAGDPLCTRCQASNQLCPRYVKSLQECPVDNVPSAPQNETSPITCSSLGDCRQCLRFSYQCKWCVSGKLGFAEGEDC
eukprot:GHUV01033211.1.p1 GENE.GHUV01033211.1~~GHUV01033211.1.p1  ORF type:complete len:556 (+),score=56.28 GHUV01033211.1:494-2161(+)